MGALLFYKDVEEIISIALASKNKEEDFSKCWAGIRLTFDFNSEILILSHVLSNEQKNITLLNKNKEELILEFDEFRRKYEKRD